ncbi:transferase family-domain-containing protein [Dactylonectria macrodidyma]|uniref:Transferase family-domain-containing protein n=1 Tax=Dactylonectria macrodidyma TaxID=307937 RepID=A0A9P9JJS8_9HYPO|nr:transferase family-domain-containing protein [Dactylonectria macrodidyma]
MGSLDPFSQIPPLTPLERIGPKGYLRYVFTSPLPDDYDFDQVSSVLKGGFDAAKQRIGVMGAEAVPDPDAIQGGVFKFRKPSDDSDIENVVSKDLRSPKAYPFTYAQLKDKAFPVSAFNAEDLCRRTVWPLPGEKLPVSLVQANFIQGGLILTWCIFHMAGDGTTFQVWTRIWAEECRRLQRLDITEPYVLDPSMMGDRVLIMNPSGNNKGMTEDHPEYLCIPFVPEGAPPKMKSPDHRGQVFYFSPESLKALKAEASPSNASEQSEQTWISTNDALSALLWRTVMAVQNPLETLEGDPVSVFNIAIDGRLRTDPPVHPNTLGCFLEYVAVSAPIRQMLSSANLADLAFLIRKALTRADKQFTDDVVTLVDKLDHVDKIVATAFTDVPGYHCVQTSWVNFDVYSIDFGPLLGGKIESIRAPHVGVINGLQVALPPLPDGGMEIMVGVESSCLDKLLHEPLWNKFAKAR